MNYETKVVDLSGSPDVTVIEGETRSGRRRLIVGAVVVVALLIAAALFYFGGSEEEAFPAKKGQQVPTVTVIEPDCV